MFYWKFDCNIHIIKIIFKHCWKIQKIISNKHDSNLKDYIVIKHTSDRSASISEGRFPFELNHVFIPVDNFWETRCSRWIWKSMISLVITQFLETSFKNVISLQFHGNSLSSILIIWTWLSLKMLYTCFKTKS